MTARARRSAVAVYAAELVVLLSLALLFIFFGGVAIVRLSALGRTLGEASVTATSSDSMIAHASSLHRSLWLRVVSTVVSVFMSFILRCVYNAMYVSSHQASVTPQCSKFGNCAECQDKLFIISNWFAVKIALFLRILFRLTRILIAGWTLLPSLWLQSLWFLSR